MLPLLLLLLPVTTAIAAAAAAAAAAAVALLWLARGAFSRTNGRSSSTHTSAQVRCIRLTCVREGKGLSRIRGMVTKGGGAILQRVAFSLPPSPPSLSLSLSLSLSSPLSCWIERGLRWTWTVPSRASSRELATMIGRARHPSM